MINKILLFKKVRYTQNQGVVNNDCPLVLFGGLTASSNLDASILGSIPEFSEVDLRISGEGITELDQIINLFVRGFSPEAIGPNVADFTVYIRKAYEETVLINGAFSKDLFLNKLFETNLFVRR